MVETRTQGNDPAPPQFIRFQFGNHLGSASLELDDGAEIISYEEYFPYGSTAYQAVRSQTETPKRYRYTGKERDEESGFTYHVARYCVPWLGRWCSTDPAGFVDGLNLYAYVRNNPILLNDQPGHQGDPQEIMMGMMWDELGREIGAMIEGVFGGSAYVSPRHDKVEYTPPQEGVGGMVGGVVRASTLRFVPIEKNPSTASLMGIEAGASLVPVLDPGARLVSGTTVTGQDTSRLWAAGELALDLLPYVLSFRYKKLTLSPKTSAATSKAPKPTANRPDPKAVRRTAGNSATEDYLKTIGEIESVETPGLMQNPGEDICLPRVLDQNLGPKYARSLSGMYQSARDQGGYYLEQGKNYLEGVLGIRSTYLPKEKFNIIELMKQKIEGRFTVVNVKSNPAVTQGHALGIERFLFHGFNMDAEFLIHDPLKGRYWQTAGELAKRMIGEKIGDALVIGAAKFSLPWKR